MSDKNIKVEEIKLQVVSPAAKLTGVDLAIERLTLLEARIFDINKLLKQPMEIMLAFKAGKEGIGQAGRMLKKAFPAERMLTPEQISKQWGWNPQAFIAHTIAMEKTIIAGEKRARSAFDTTGAFSSVRIMNKSFQAYYNAQAKQTTRHIGALLESQVAHFVQAPLVLMQAAAQASDIIGKKIEEQSAKTTAQSAKAATQATAPAISSTEAARRAEVLARGANAQKLLDRQPAAAAPKPVRVAAPPGQRNPPLGLSAGDVIKHPQWGNVTVVSGTQYKLPGKFARAKVDAVNAKGETLGLDVMEARDMPITKASKAKASAKVFATSLEGKRRIIDKVASGKFSIDGGQVVDQAGLEKLFGKAEADAARKALPKNGAVAPPGADALKKAHADVAEMHALNAIIAKEQAAATAATATAAAQTQRADEHAKSFDKKEQKAAPDARPYIPGRAEKLLSTREIKPADPLKPRIIAATYAAGFEKTRTDIYKQFAGGETEALHSILKDTTPQGAMRRQMGALKTAYTEQTAIKGPNDRSLLEYQQGHSAALVAFAQRASEAGQHKLAEQATTMASRVNRGATLTQQRIDKQTEADALKQRESAKVIASRLAARKTLAAEEELKATIVSRRRTSDGTQVVTERMDGTNKITKTFDFGRSGGSVKELTKDQAAALEARKTAEEKAAGILGDKERRRQERLAAKAKRDATALANEAEKEAEKAAKKTAQTQAQNAVAATRQAQNNAKTEQQQKDLAESLATRKRVQRQFQQELTNGAKLLEHKYNSETNAARFITERVVGVNRIRKEFTIAPTGGKLVTTSTDITGQREQLDAARQKESEKLARKQFDQVRAHQEKKDLAVVDAERVAKEHAATRAQLNQAIAGGAVTQSTRTRRGGKQGDTERVVTSQDMGGGRIVQSTFTFTKAGASLTQFDRALKATRNELGYLGKDFIRNTEQVTTWAASVGALYGSLALLKRGAEGVIHIEASTARLAQIFKGTALEARQLALNVLGVAASNGRSAEEATASAVAWSRLRMSQAETMEAVRVSMVGANVANVTVEESTTRLIGIMLSYKLQAKDLAGVLGQINQISNTSAVAVSELIAGVSRAGGVARQTGLGLTELIGIIDAAAAQSQQSGVNIGNAVKSVIMAMSNPALQQELRKGFNFEVRTNSGEIASMGTILDRLYLKYKSLSGLERQSLVNSIAGKTQGNRLTEILDSYLIGLRQAINAQLHLNSAEQENARITATMKAQMTGLITQWETFASATMGGKFGPMTLLSGMTVGLRNVLALLASPGGAALSKLFLTAGSVMGVRMLATSLSLSAASAGASKPRGGFVYNTRERLKQTLSEMNGLLETMTTQYLNAPTGGVLTARKPGRETWMGRGVAGGLAKAWSWQEYAEGKRKEVAAYRSRLDETVVVPQGNLHLVGRATPDPLKAVTTNLAKTTLAGRTSAMAMAMAAQGAATFASAMSLAARATLGLVVATRALLVSVGLPLLAIVAAFAAFNRAMEYLGYTSERSNARLAAFNETAQAASAHAGAARDSVRLFGLALDSLALPGANVGEIVKNLAEVETLTPEVRKKLVAANGDKTKVVPILEQAKSDQMKEMEVQQKAARAANIAAKKEADDDYAQRKATFDEHRAKANFATSGFGSLWHKFREGKDPDKMTEEAARRAQLGLSVKQDQDEVDEQTDKVLAGDDKHLANLERMRVTLQGMSDLMQAMPGFTRLDRASSDLFGTQASIKTLESSMEAASARAVALSAKAAGTPGGKLVGDEAAEQLRLRAEFNTNWAKGKELRAKAEGQKVAATFAAKQDQWELVTTRQHERMGAEGYGASEAEKLLRQKAATEKSIAADQKLLGSTSGEDKEQARVRILASITDKSRLLLEIDRQRFDLARQQHQILIDSNREFQRSLLLAGPADLLRKMAAFQAVKGAGKRGVSLGQFMGASPQVREEMQKLGAFNPALIENARARRLLGTGPSDAEMVKAQQAGNTEGNVQRKALAEESANTMYAGLAAQELVTAELGRLAGGASAATQAFLAFTAALVGAPRDQLIASGAGTRGQYGGVGGAAGHQPVRVTR